MSTRTSPKYTKPKGWFCDDFEVYWDLRAKSKKILNCNMVMYLKKVSIWVFLRALVTENANLTKSSQIQPFGFGPFNIYMNRRKPKGVFPSEKLIRSFSWEWGLKSIQFDICKKYIGVLCSKHFLYHLTSYGRKWAIYIYEGSKSKRRNFARIWGLLWSESLKQNKY